MHAIVSGTLPVSRAFWLGVVSLFFPVALCLGYLLYLGDATDSPETRTQAQIGRIALCAVFVLYLTHIASGLYKFAIRPQTAGLWAGLAALATALLALSVAHFAYDPWYYKWQVRDALSRVPPSPELVQEVAIVQEGLPLELSKTVTVESAALENRELVFAVVGKGQVQEHQINKIEDQMWELLTTKAPYCAELRTAFELGLWTAVYEIRFDNSVFVVRLAPKQCAEGYEHEDLVIRRQM